MPTVYTAAPWTYSGWGRLVHAYNRKPQSTPIAELRPLGEYYMTNTETVANGHVIAAAPELLERVLRIECVECDWTPDMWISDSRSFPNNTRRAPCEICRDTVDLVRKAYGMDPEVGW